MINSINLIIIIIAVIGAFAASYMLYAIILFQGSTKKGDNLQLSTKNILEQVEILYDKKEYALVELLATKYLDRVPSHSDVRTYLAKAYFEDKKYNQAIKHCLLVLTKKNNFETRKLLAKCYVKKGSLEKAVKEYEEAYEQNKNDKEVIQNLAKLYRETEQNYLSIEMYRILADNAESDDESAEIQWILAELNEIVHDYPAAFDAYKTRLAIYPTDYSTNKKLTELYIQLNNYPAAIETLLYMLTFVKDSKQLLWVHEILIDLYVETEEYEKAIEYSENLLNIQGADKFKVRNDIANFNVKLNNIGIGIEMLEELALMSQNGFDVTVQLADAYLKNKEYQKAFEKYTLLMDKATQNEAKVLNLLICELYITWAIDLASEKKYTESFEMLKNAAQYNPINSEIYYNIAKNNYELKNYNPCVDSINKAIEYNKQPENQVKYILLLADAHHQLNNFFEEKKALTDLLKIDDKNAQGLFRIGLMHIAQHDVKNAEEAFKTALLYEPNMLQAKYNLALIYESNNMEKAKELYMEILEADPSFIEAKNALADMSSSDFI